MGAQLGNLAHAGSDEGQQSPVGGVAPQGLALRVQSGLGVGRAVEPSQAEELRGLPGQLADVVIGLAGAGDKLCHSQLALGQSAGFIGKKDV